MESTPGRCLEPTGSITAVAVGGTGPILYSIDGDKFDINNTFTGLAGGEYTLTVRDQNNCRLSTTVNIPRTVVPEIDSLESSPSDCNDRGGRIEIQASGGTAPLSYSLNGVDYVDQAVFSDVSSGRYMVFVRDANGCTASAEVSLTSSDGPVFADIVLRPASGSALNGEIRVMVVGGSEGIIFSLNGQSTQDEGIFSGLGSGEYQVVATDAWGCSTDTLLILPNSGYEVYIPNVFSPDGDGVNDVFRPMTSSNANIVVRSLKIFDRWGSLVFIANNLPIESNSGWWSGSFRGEPTPAGVYTYFMTLEGEVGETNLISGDVLLLR